MPESIDVNLEELSTQCKKIISKIGEIGKVEYKPIAFGLKAIELMAIMDESKGSTEEIENEIRNLHNVTSAEVTDVRRTVDL